MVEAAPPSGPAHGRGVYAATLLEAADFDDTIAAPHHEHLSHVPPIRLIYARAIFEVFMAQNTPYRADAAREYRRVMSMGRPGEAYEMLYLTPIQLTQKVLRCEGDDPDLMEWTERLVQAKLDQLLPLIGTPLRDGRLWPTLSDGFHVYWDELARAQAEGLPVGTAIVSAGHAPFIQKTFELWGISLPDILVTEETMRHKYGSLPVEQTIKPAPLPLQEAYEQWQQQLGRRADIADKAANMVHYAGDSDYKDGGMARQFGASFQLMDTNHLALSWAICRQRLKTGLDQVRASRIPENA